MAISLSETGSCLMFFSAGAAQYSLISLATRKGLSVVVSYRISDSALASSSSSFKRLSLLSSEVLLSSLLEPLSEAARL